MTGEYSKHLTKEFFKKFTDEMGNHFEPVQN